MKGILTQSWTAKTTDQKPDNVKSRQYPNVIKLEFRAKILENSDPFWHNTD